MAISKAKHQLNFHHSADTTASTVIEEGTQREMLNAARTKAAEYKAMGAEISRWFGGERFVAKFATYSISLWVAKAPRAKNSSFGKGGTFVCADCGKRTRQTGSNSNVDLCTACYERNVDENE